MAMNQQTILEKTPDSAANDQDLHSLRAGPAPNLDTQPGSDGPDARDGSIDVSLVIPVHNEQDALKVLIPLLIDETEKLDKTFEIIFVNDGSTDATRSIIEPVSKVHPSIHLINLNERRGQTEAFRKAFELASGRYIMRMDGDMQDDPRDLRYFIEKIDQGYDTIVGIREARKHRRIFKLASRIFDLIVLTLLNTPFRENSASFVAFKADLVKDIPFCRNDHRFLIIIALSRGIKKPGEIIVRHNPRLGGTSKYRVVHKLFWGLYQLMLVLIRISRDYYKKRAYT